jgi:hypothetical protein
MISPPSQSRARGVAPLAFDADQRFGQPIAERPSKAVHMIAHGLGGGA